VNEHRASTATLCKIGFRHWLVWLAITKSRAQYLLLPGLINPKVALHTRASILVNFAKHMAHNGYAAGSIAGYCTHVRNAHKDLLDLDLVEGSVVWKRYSKALSNEASNPQNAKHPVSIQLLQACAHNLGTRSATRCAMVIAFFGLLRRKEWSAKSKTSARAWQLCRTHVKLFDSHDALLPVDTELQYIDHAQILVYRKGDSNKTGHNISLFRNHTEVCPLHAIFLALKIAPDKSPHSPLFQESNGEYVRSDDVARALKAAAAKYGLNPKKFAAHSLRRGGAQALRDAGFSEEFIKKYGAWRSDANKRYHSAPASECKDVARRMIKSSSTQLPVE
jgi:hypothetical protein